MKIRGAKREDLKEIAEIMMEESAKEPYNEKYTLRIAVKEVGEFFEDELYVAIEDGKIIGFVASGVTSENDKRVYVNELWVGSDYQKRGIGKALLGFVEKIYREKGFRKIRLTVRRDAEAFKFYKKMKYEEYKKLVYMEKKL